MNIGSIGIVEGVSVGSYDTESLVINLIAKKRDLDKKLISEILKHNVVTVNQLAVILGKSASSINQMTKPRVVGQKMVTQLDRCYPFSSSKDGDHGPVFIHRNEKFDNLINDFLEISEEK